MIELEDSARRSQAEVRVLHACWISLRIAFVCTIPFLSKSLIVL
jgi:hypothetical protein